jgi:hypothetical protein
MAGSGSGSSVKLKPAKVGVDDLPSAKDLPWRDKLMALGGILEGDPGAVAQMQLLAAARAQQKQQAGLDAEFAAYLTGQGLPKLNRTEKPAIAPEPPPEQDVQQSGAASVLARLGGGADALPKLPRVDVNIPQYSVSQTGGRTGPPTLRDALPLLMRRRAAGMDIKPDIEMLDKAGPEVRYERGVRYDARDLSTAPREIIDVDKGQQRVFDADGKVIGVMNAKGYVQSVEELERAKTAAQEGAKAGYDVGIYEDAKGVPRRMTRAQAVGALNGGLPAIGGGAIPASSLPASSAARGYPDISRGQTAAEKKLAEGRADTQVAREAAQPKAYSGLATQRRTTDLVISSLDKALSQIDGSLLGGTTGLNELSKFVPGTKSRDLDATLDTIRSAVGFDKLAEMRANSPTGGALGNVSNAENKLLQAVSGSLDQGQSAEQMRENLTRVRDQLKKAKAEREAAYGRQYSAPAAGASITPDQARAELARRRAARGGQ